MKKIFVFLLIAFVLPLVACENSTDITAAYIYENTTADRSVSGVKISYAEDERLKGKYTDVQVRFAKKGEIVIWEENQEKITYEIPDYDEWYSLTSIFCQAEGKEGEEKFEYYDKVKSKSYLFTSETDQQITFRVVVGKITSNFNGDGQILVGSEPISRHFTLKINKN